MTREDIQELINDSKNAEWKQYFSADEWLKIVEGLYGEYSLYSKMDFGFDMYYQLVQGKLLMNNGHKLLRLRFL